MNFKPCIQRQLFILTGVYDSEHHDCSEVTTRHEGDYGQKNPWPLMHLKAWLDLQGQVAPITPIFHTASSTDFSLFSNNKASLNFSDPALPLAKVLPIAESKQNQILQIIMA